MFARVMHIQAKPGQLDAITALYCEAVVPVLRLEPGFVSSLLLPDPDTGKGMSIAMWNSQEDQDTSDSVGTLQAQIHSVIPLLETPPTREGYVVELLA